MSEEKSRVERKKEKSDLQAKSKASLNKVYYWVIAFLFLILLLLVFFIFTKSDDKVKLDSKDALTEKVEENEKNLEDKTTSNSEKESSEEEKEENQNDPSKETEDSEEESEEDLESGEEIQVNEEAAHDPDHETDFSDGSADRLAIKEEIMKATGLESDLIEYWVGNDGPARVSATVTSSDKTEVYEVHLQYGDEKWQVLNYKKLEALPEEFN